MLYCWDGSSIIQVTWQPDRKLCREFKQALTEAYLAVTRKHAEHSTLIIIFMNSIELLKILVGGK